MSPVSSNSEEGKRRILRLLIAFALTTVCLGSVVAMVIYADTHSATESDNLVRHSQEVLLSLSDVAQDLDRADLNAQLYRMAGDEDQLRAAQGATALLDANLQHLTRLVADNRTQTRWAKDLTAAANVLTDRVNRLSPESGSIRDQVVTCRRYLNQMQEEERTLLAQRGEEAERNNLYGLARRIATVVVGMVLVLVLFGFLIRDAMRRQQFEMRLSEATEQMRTTVQRLEEQAWLSRLLIAARDEVALCVDVDQAEACTVRYLEQLLPGTAGSLYIIDHSRQQMESVGWWGRTVKPAYDAFEPESCCGLRSGRARWRRPEHSEVHCGHFLGVEPERYLCLPLIAHGETLGIVYIECPSVETAAMTEARESTLGSLGEMAAMAIAGLHLRLKLENQSIRDGMTGLFNRSFMEVALAQELHRAARQEKEVAVMMMDVDRFKEFNDTFGHEAGDMVLREVAEAIRACVRGEDIVCRYGGEEFVVILPETDAESALERAELLRTTVAEMALRYHGEPLRKVTMSVGIGMYPENAQTSEDLLRSADRALYAAKHRGRNRVFQADMVEV